MPVKVYFERPLLVAYVDGYDYRTYNGKEELEMNKDKFKVYQKIYQVIYLKSKEKKVGLKESYEYYTKCCAKLMEASKGLINLKKSGTFAKTGMYVWQKLGFLKNITIEVQPLNSIEKMLIKKTMSSALIFAKKYTGEAYLYDFKSFYPYIVSSNKFMIPINNCKEKIITTMNETKNKYNTYIFGIYRCKVYESNNEDTDKFFAFNENNLYSHYDLQSADILKLKVELINDGQTNMYYWERNDCKTGLQVFGKFYNYIYKLKEKKIEGAKDIMNNFLGYLYTQSKDKEKIIKLNMYEPAPEGKIKKIETNIENETNIYFVEGEETNFLFDWARIKPFVYSNARLEYVKRLYKYKDVIVRCHTDSLLCTKKIDIEAGLNLGDICYEAYYEHCEVVNKKTVIGNKIKIEYTNEDKQICLQKIKERKQIQKQNQEYKQLEQEFYKVLNKEKGLKK